MGKQSKKTTAAVAVAKKKSVVLDMETGDVDDLLTLCLALCNEQMNVVAVCVTPGSLDQLRLIRYVLVTLLGKSTADSIPLGAQEWPKHEHKRGCVNLKQYAMKVFQLDEDSSKELEKIHINRSQVYDAADLIYQNFPSTQQQQQQAMSRVLLTCGPVHNLGAALQKGAVIPKWIAQGGFCGSNVIDDSSSEVMPTLPEFVGHTYYPSWNFGGSIESALFALQSEQIGKRILVGKNVCHRCVYTDEMEQRVKEWAGGAAASQQQRPGKNKRRGALNQKIQQQRQTAAAWILQTRKSKKLHDPLALATLVDEENVCTLREVRVEMEDQTRHWGSVLCPGTRTFAAVDYDHERFLDALFPDA